MKRRSPLAAVFALPCLILAPLPAHAAAVPLPNTVAAIMARIAQGGGVTLTQHGSSRVYGGYTAERRVYSAGYTTQAKGRLDLTGGGVSGADVQRRLTFNAALRGQTAKEVAAAGDKYVASLIPQTSWHRWISVKGWLVRLGSMVRGRATAGQDLGAGEACRRPRRGLRRPVAQPFRARHAQSTDHGEEPQGPRLRLDRPHRQEAMEAPVRRRAEF